MSIFKVGDKVRIKRGLIVGVQYGGIYLNNVMMMFRGEEFVVIEDTGYNTYLLDTPIILFYSREMLEPVENNRKAEKLPDSYEIKSGDKLIINGILYTVTDSGILVISKLQLPCLSDKEYIILQNISMEYKYIRRTKAGLRLYKCLDTDKGSIGFGVYNHLFTFIKASDKKATSIEELIKEYETNIGEKRL